MPCLVSACPFPMAGQNGWAMLAATARASLGAYRCWGSIDRHISVLNGIHNMDNAIHQHGKKSQPSENQSGAGEAVAIAHDVGQWGRCPAVTGQRTGCSSAFPRPGIKYSCTEAASAIPIISMEASSSDCQNSFCGPPPPSQHARCPGSPAKLRRKG